MKNSTKLLAILLVGISILSCNLCKQNTEPELFSDWINDAVLYEVNIRQYTPEGTFNAFAEHLPRLKELGVDILWIMPIHPISELKRKGTLGSYYAVADYLKVNPEFGTMDDFKTLVNKSHDLGMKVVIDWVANHTGWDNPWIYDHPEWFTKDSTGVIIPPVPDWSDVADLNFDQQPMRKAMINAMDFWLTEANIDGFRCDVAWGVPQDFWEAARASFDSIKPVYMLAEDEDHPGFLDSAFHSNYAWNLHHIMNEVAKGEKTALDIKDYFTTAKDKYAEGSFPMQFITNHDENSWAGTIEERMGKAGDAFAVFSFTIPGIPLIHSGQEAGLNKRLEFFEKDEIDWANLSKQDFYTSLTKLKSENKALWNGSFGGNMEVLETSAPEQVFAFKRTKDDSQVLVVLNLSEEITSVEIELGELTNYTAYWSNEKIPLGGNVKFDIEPWNYLVFTK